METIIAMTPSHLCDAKIAIAASRAGELGILDLGDRTDETVIRDSIEELTHFAGTKGRWGVRWDTFGEAFLDFSQLSRFLSQPVDVLVLAGVEESDIAGALERCRPFAREIFLEVIQPSAALAAEAARVDGLILRGHEAGGKVGNSGTFIFLQQLYGKLKGPYWVQGGIGLHTAAAVRMAGAAGVVLCEQLWLTDESPFSDEDRNVLSHLDGGETVCIDLQEGYFRCYSRSGPGKIRDVLRLVSNNSLERGNIHHYLQSRSDEFIPLGQDIGCAGSLARHYGTVGRICTAIRASIAEHTILAQQHDILAPGSPLAQEHGTRYPIVQGPMAQVSDVVPFCKTVGIAGGLPFLALSLMKSENIYGLLREAHSQMGSMPWGVGMLGFLPRQVRQDQLKAIQEIRPRFAIIAGGRPGQAAELENMDISTYLHVPSPSLLSMFIKQGARKFIFEGKECGGHVGPRTCFVLWESAVETLLESGIDNPGEVQILFAGGIHDGLSAAMVNTIAAPLASVGMKIGIVMGTAYLFTPEAVQCGAITEEYQRQALACVDTVLLESGAGHASRCVKTPFTDEFNAKKRELIGAGETDEQIRLQLEMLNLGRLRTASKGIARNPKALAADESDKFVLLNTEDQIREGMYMLGQVAETRNSTISVAELHSEVSMGGSKRLRNSPAPCPEKEYRSPNRDPIAIVGMACMFPHAEDLREYWENILNGVDTVREIAEDRWRSAEFYSNDRTAADKTYSKWGGFLKDVPFNPLMYGIPPVSLKSIEPIQLLALEIARQALEDAGYYRRGFPRNRTATIFGVGGAHDLAIAYSFRTMMRHYLARMEKFPPDIRDGMIETLSDMLPKWTEDSFPGILDNVVAGRIANRFDLGGSNFSVDAACASSLAALDSGVRQLRTHACDVALVGAVDGTNNVLGYLCFSRSQAFSPRGRCYTFDDSADGMVIGEGVAAVVLKRLEDAERDGDHVYSVIKGIGTSSDGRNRSLTAPHLAGQVKALRRAYEDADVCPSTVELVEAHGTGTAIGDKTEIQSLTEVFNASMTTMQHCAIGSVKSMIGHTKVAAGMASLIKCALALKHRILPSTLGVTVPNTLVDFSRSPFYINTDSRPWIGNNVEHPRRCGISAFGFGGSNFHVVMEEYSRDLRGVAKVDLLPRAAEIISFARATPSEMQAVIKTLSMELEQISSINLAQLAYSIYLDEQKGLAGKDGSSCRLAIVASSLEDLRIKLHLALKGFSSGEGVIKNSPGLYYRESSSEMGGLCFLFPGQGAQRINMLKDLVILMPSMYDLFKKADELLKPCFKQPLSQYIYPLPVFSDAERKRQQEELNDTRVAQPALGVVDLVAMEILETFGLRANFMAGHSYGEYVALHAAGVISREDLLRLSEVRGKTVNDACANLRGTMAAVQADAEKTAAVLKELGLENLFLANLNAPNQTIIGGSVESIDEAIKVLNGEGMFSKKIPVCAAFHTPLMDEASERLASEFSKIHFRPPQAAVFSNTTGKLYPESPQEIHDLLLQHLCHPVRFEQQVRNLYAAGARIFIETGPDRILTSLVNRILGDMPHTALSLDVPGRSGCLSLSHLLAHTWVLGLPVDFKPWFAGRRLEKIGSNEVFKRSDMKSNPSPNTWKINTHKIEPWYGPGGTEPGKTEPSGASERSISQSSSASTQTAPLRTPVSQSQEKRNTMNDLSKNVQTGIKETKISLKSQGREAVIPLIQSTMQEFFKLQQEEQKVMHRFLALQERMLESALNGNQIDASAKELLDATATPVRSMDISIVSQNVPPAPVLPKWAEQPSNTVQGNATDDSGLNAEGKSAAPVKASGDSAKSNKEIPDKDAFLENLLRTVSERTGYPKEMLGLDLHMEADLGIDSIKKVEIFSGMNEHYEVMQALDQETLIEQLAGLTTLKEIVDWYDRNRTAMLGIVSSSSPQSISSEQGILKFTELEPPPVREMNVSMSEDFPSADFPPDVSSTVLLPPGGAADLHADPVKRGVLRAIASPFDVTSEAVRFPPDQIILCLMERYRKSAFLEALFPPSDYRMIQVIPGKETKMLEINQYEVDFSSLESVRDLSSLMVRSKETVGAVFNLLSLWERGDGGSAEVGSEAKYDDARKLFVILKVFEKELKAGVQNGGGWLVNMTSMDGRFGLKKGECFPFGQAGSVGLTKSIAREWPDLKVKSIDIDTSGGFEIIQEKVREELRVFDELVEVGLDEEGRWRIEPVEDCGDSEVWSRLPIGSESLILVTGGARGITAEITKALAAEYRPHIVIVGRSTFEEQEPLETRELSTPQELREFLMKKLRQEDPGITPVSIEKHVLRILAQREVRENLKFMRAQGANLEYHSLDVKDGFQFGNLIDNIYKKFGRIDGVIHGAGINEDKWVRNKDLDSFARVFDTKVIPARVLGEKLHPDGLKFMVFFSSVAGRFGSAGQTDYSAANEVLNKMAVHFDRIWSGRVVSINWGPWEMGMVSEFLKDYFVEKGVNLIPAEEGVRMFFEELQQAAYSAPEVLISRCLDGLS